MKSNISIYFTTTMLISIGIIMTSCESFLDVDDPKSLVAADKVFSNDVTATAAVTGIYSDLMNPSGFASGTNVSITALAGVSADELVDFSRKNDTNLQFEQNRIQPANANILTLWNSMYASIYQCNAVIQGLDVSTGLTTETKNQLKGEALLVRAFAHFYLVNFFGEVPIITTTDYEANSIPTRTAESEVYALIISDLREASTLMGEEYPTLASDFITRSRARPNRYAAMALLSRVYLFQSDWAAAEAFASQVINQSDRYQLVADLSGVFKMNSAEAIWQIHPQTAGPNGATNEAFYFANFNLNFNILNESLLTAFESGDNRKSQWINSVQGDDGTIYYPFKYQQPDIYSTLTEYSTVIRLSEIYLIRSEARAKLGNISAGTEDLDTIRNRAGLQSILVQHPNITKEQLLTAIEHERQVELFTEWGHRWLDIKRSGTIAQALVQTKGAWDPNDALYPLPASEFEKNRKLGRQNPGY